MAEFIEREALIKSDDWQSLKSDFDKARAHIIILGQPAANVVEVVRCKECRYSNPHLHYFYCENDNAPWAENTMANLVDANDFCSYGERRCEE
ncbi:MAG: hypothetical protein IKK09_01590 [Clostridia bacterium]|nr:hypothetical protein [Clostridia bacterium]